MNLSASVVNISSNLRTREYVHPLINKNPIHPVNAVRREPEFAEIQSKREPGKMSSGFEDITISSGLSKTSSRKSLGSIIDIYV